MGGWGNALPVAPAFQSYSSRQLADSRSSDRQSWMWIIVASVAGVMVIGTATILLVVILSAGNSSNNRSTQTAWTPPQSSPAPPKPTGAKSAAGASGPTLLPSRQPHPFPKLGPAFPFTEDISFHRVTILRDSQRPLTLNVFIPKGEHADKSLPVMFEAPNGTTLMHGADISIPNRETEFLPFTESLGMITVTFSIDGPIPRNLMASQDQQYLKQLEVAYREFTAADAGVDSGKLAIDYVLKEIPAADPTRFYMWGHSSSGTLALLLASKDKRIAKCIAMAPVTDLEKRLGHMVSNRSMAARFPNLDEYFQSGSPLSHVKSLKCPVYIVHAKDDENEPFKNTEIFVQALRRAGNNPTFDVLDSGGHGGVVVSIPRVLDWLERP
jgi:dienelactone hydrolase